MFGVLGDVALLSEFLETPYFNSFNTAFLIFMGRGFTSDGKELESVFSAVVCKIQASKHYIESLPLVEKIKEEAVSLKMKAPLYNCPLIVHLPSRSIGCLN